ncbi:protein 60A-like [Anopheles arabiensis]|uniref:AGAP011934-PA n=2 Tax=gambiae species complex TaxID=44542 RepID=Q7PZI7_ANOGA|nr:protein 60A-like [Anopheles arabiensis]AAT07300.1 Gbb-60A2 [Anopheles gambiae]EAA00276.3 AGAP011934-PA [Anopheles gambiae str. PEST]
MFRKYSLCAAAIVLYVLIGLVSSTGFYIDNGVDQTVREKSVELHERQEIEHEILELLGLPDRPNKQHVHPSLRKSAPQFLLNIYHKFTEEMNGGRRRKRYADGANLLTIADERAIGESDVIMSFLNKANRHLPKIRHHRGGHRLWFDTAEIDAERDNNQLLYASLRMYKNRTTERPWDAIVRGRQIVVRASLIGGYDAAKDGHRLELVAEQSVPYNYDGWVELNATQAMQRWVVERVANKGIFVEVYYAESPRKEILPHEVGLILSNRFGRYQPFLVGYCKGPELVKPTAALAGGSGTVGGRSKRSVRRKAGTGTGKRSDRVRNPFLERFGGGGERHKSCQIQTLYVSFRDLNWQDWIIAPDGFGAFFCFGECNFPLNTHMNATNHALIQTLVHLMHPTRVPKPCCAPTKLNPISVLYHIDDANINLKKYKNMVVKSCGCL